MVVRDICWALSVMLHFVLVLSRLSVQLKLGDFGGFKLSTEVVTICCILFWKQPVGFMVSRRESRSPGWLVNLHLHEGLTSAWRLIPPLHEEIPSKRDPF